MARVYLASPYGFAASTKPFLDSLKSALQAAGHDVTDPWEYGDSILGASRERLLVEGDAKEGLLGQADQDLAHRNKTGIDAADVVVAGLDGPDVDSGTASEIGYAFATGKAIIGYRSDIRRSGENSSARVNLQVQYWIEASDSTIGRIVNTVPELLKALAAFEGHATGPVDRARSRLPKVHREHP